ncbi:MAG: PorV/PorQ family protein [Calditrichaceae bacterium]|nr:PorV/PorQ family protein [Calditrichaceae bacterium]MBN2708467.1 PorV/PorQ family protein [Calditrichaceae bacterium]RQV93080.1 MAG: PorV/PorQ family protein [Calditrichota bacterium]
MKKITILITILFLLFFSGSVFAGVSKTGTSASKFLSFSIGPRAIAMGGAFSSICNDASAMYWNSAGIAQLGKNEVMFTHTNWLADIQINYVGLVMPLGQFGNIGVNITAMTMGDMEETTEFYPEGTGNTFGAGSYAFGLSYGRYLYTNFMIGVNLKYIRENISQSNAQGLAIDIGTIFTTPFWGVKFATSITNFGTKMQMTGDDMLIKKGLDDTRSGSNDQLDTYLATDAFELPLRLQIGVSKDLLISEQRLTLAFDAAHPNDNTEYVNFGAELALLNEMVFLRGGYKTLFIEYPEEGLTLGGGFNYNHFDSYGLQVDYAYQQMKYLGDLHTFGFIFRF